MSLASATTRWCLTAANRVMTVSAKQGPQTATCHKTEASPSGHPTTASVWPPPQNVQVPTRSPPTTFHWCGPGAVKEDERLRAVGGRTCGLPWNGRPIITLRRRGVEAAAGSRNGSFGFGDFGALRRTSDARQPTAVGGVGPTVGSKSNRVLAPLPAG
jgi:hypothetical protein